jgi:hypothetical protein
MERMFTLEAKEIHRKGAKARRNKSTRAVSAPHSAAVMDHACMTNKENKRAGGEEI